MFNQADHNRSESHRPMNSGGGRVVAALLLIVLLGFLLRVGDLKSQSVWGDDYFCIGFLEEPDWGSFRTAMLPYSPDMPPLYFGLIYGWSRLFGTAPIVIRLFSVLFGVLSILLVFLLGRRILDPSMALLAALLLALSPLQTFHAQDMRGYALTVFFGLLSAWTFVRMVEGGGWRWWIANATATILLIWIHLAGMLLALTWGICALLWLRPHYRRIVIWTGIQIIGILPLLGLVRTIIEMAGRQSHPLQREMISGMVAPAVNFFMQNGAYLDWSLPRIHHFETGLVAENSLFFLVDLFNAISHLSLLFLSLYLVAIHRKSWVGAGQGERVASAHVRHIAAPTCILLWFFIPFLVLLFAAYLLDPARMQIRYLLFASPALYLLAALALTRIKFRAVRHLCTLLLVLSFAMLAALNMLLPVRGDYLGATAFINAMDAERPILVRGDDYITPYLIAYNGDIPLNSITATLEMQDLSVALDGIVRDRGRAWFILEDTNLHDAAEVLRSTEALLAEKGFLVIRHYFGGVQKLIVHDLKYNHDADEVSGREAEQNRED